MPRAISRAAVRMKSLTTGEPMTCSTSPSDSSRRALVEDFFAAGFLTGSGAGTRRAASSAAAS